MKKKDYYKILEVSKTVSKEELKKKYRELCLKYHPDKNPGDKEAEERFKEIAEAYSVIGDEEKRRKYDQGGFDFRGFPGDFGGFGGGFDMDDIFSQFFGAHRGGWGQRRPQPQKGSDLRIKIVLKLDEIFTGTTKKVKYRKEVICGTCNGTGAANASSVHTCNNCQGSGWVQKVKNTIVGTVVSQEQCSVCSGTGKIIQSVCPTCGGKKITFHEETVDLTIPKSVRDGDILSFAGAGNVSKNGGANGNLLVVIEEEHHEFFIRKESELYVRCEISIYDAIFGKDLEIKTIEGGVIKVAITPGTQSSSRLRVEGKGMYKMGTNYRGDMYIDVVVYIPNNLSDKEKEILEQLKDSENIKPIKK